MSSPGPVTPPSSPPRVPSRYSMGSSSNMVRSLLVILAIVAGLVAIVPRTTGITQPPVDAASVVSDAVMQSGLPFEAPVGLPAGWTPTNARYAASTDGLATWQGGWSTPEGGYIAIRQTKTASPAWVKAATSEGTPTGRVDVGGRTWARYLSTGAQPRTSLVDVPAGAAAGTGIATVVTATAAEDELATFVKALRPAQPR
ncbi:MAG: DUF4245 domain-containing protein [Lapillicoccus sp.]